MYRLNGRTGEGRLGGRTLGERLDGEGNFVRDCWSGRSTASRANGARRAFAPLARKTAIGRVCGHDRRVAVADIGRS